MAELRRVLCENRDGEDERRNLVKNSPLSPYILRLTNRSHSLLSFGKFLELLVYSHSFHIITPPLCEHTGPSVKTDGASSRPGLNIARHFTYRAHRITFTLATVEEIYNVEVPRVQFAHGPRVSEETKPIPGSPAAPLPSTSSAEPETNDDVRRMLKREMRAWWHTLSERIDNLASSPFLHGLPDPRLILV